MLQMASAPIVQWLQLKKRDYVTQPLNNQLFELRYVTNTPQHRAESVYAPSDLDASPPTHLLVQHATPEHYIRLPVKQRERPVATLARSGDLSLILPRNIALQCQCQLVGRNAARRLLAATERIDRPVDTFLQMHWITGQPIHALMGTGNAEVAGQIGGSTIQKKTSGSEKLAREVKRAWYRLRLHRHPQLPLAENTRGG